MPHALWNGSISFGLVTIPVKLFPAVRADEDVHFHFLHAKDHGRLKTVRTCELDGEEVAWKDTVRGFAEILDGKCDDLPEQAFYLVGTIEDAREKAERLARGE